MLFSILYLIIRSMLLRELAAEFEARSSVLTVVEVDEEVAAELASLASDIVQLTREALSNVGKHAAATTCRVTVRRSSADRAELEVEARRKAGRIAYYRLADDHVRHIFLDGARHALEETAGVV